MKFFVYLIKTLLLILVISVSGTYASFSENEQSNNNLFTASKIDLVMNGAQPTVSPVITFANLKPSQNNNSNPIIITLKNTGDMPASNVSLGIAGKEYKENGCIEPEVSSGDATCSVNTGELQSHIRLTLKTGSSTVFADKYIDTAFLDEVMLGPLLAGQTKTYNLTYHIGDGPNANRIMTDSVIFNLVGRLYQ